MARWYDETFEGNLRLGLKGGRMLFREQSAYQTVEIFETERYGRVLALDGVFMTSEVDEFFYHEMLVHPAMTTAERIARVLIIGGGDGGSARRVLGYPEVEEVLLVEIDAMVVEASRAHLPGVGPSWDDPRLEVRIEDGTAFVARETGGAFDVILVDGTDPVGPAEGLFGRDFFAHLAARLAPGGTFAMQSESPLLFPKVFRETQVGLSQVFGSAHPYFGPVPLYPSGTWSYTWASREGDPRAPRSDRLAHAERSSRYYNAEIHRAAFAQPTYVARLLAP